MGHARREWWAIVNYSGPITSVGGNDPMPQPIHRLKLSGSADLIEIWHAALSSWTDSVLYEKSFANFEVVAEAWKLGTLNIHRNTKNVPVKFTRHRRHLKNNEPCLHVRVALHGDTLLDIEGRQYLLKAGRIQLIDYSRTLTGLSAQTTLLGTFIPHSAVGYDPSFHPPVIEIDMGSPLGRILADFIADTFERVRAMDARTTTALEPGFYAFISTYVRNTLPEMARPDFQAARSNSMHRFIDQNLHLPEIGIDTLLAKFGAARATIYRDFEDDGGIASYITGRRLDKACEELALSLPRRGLVTEVAEKWHFSSTSHFCKLFKEKFGVSPSEMAGQSELAISGLDDRPQRSGGG
jgi:AraC-like DNA-binding protein